MVKLTKSYVNGTITSTLEFRGEAYTMTEPPPNQGYRESLEPCFGYQFRERHSCDPNIDDIFGLMNRLAFDNEDDGIEEALSELLYLEEDLT